MENNEAPNHRETDASKQRPNVHSPSPRSRDRDSSSSIHQKKLLYVQGSAIVNHGMCSFGLKHARLCHMNMPNGLGACIGRLVLQYGWFHYEVWDPTRCSTDNDIQWRLSRRRDRRLRIVKTCARANMCIGWWVLRNDCMWDSATVGVLFSPRANTWGSYRCRTSKYVYVRGHTYFIIDLSFFCCRWMDCSVWMNTNPSYHLSRAPRRHKP